MLVLVLGLTVIGAAVFFIFIHNKKTPDTIWITNLIISLGFLIYVVYSILSANNLNTEIRQLSKQIEALKDDIAKKDQELDKRQDRIKALETDLAAKDEAIEAEQTKVTDLDKKVSVLEKQLAELKSSKPDTQA